MNYSSYNVCINDHCLDGNLSTGRLLNYSFTIDVSNVVANYELVLSILQIDIEGKKSVKGGVDSRVQTLLKSIVVVKFILN